jgi:hypothetical protein
MGTKVLGLVLALFAAQGTSGIVTGELKKWHKVTVTFDGPSTSEAAGANPFRDFRLNVTFTRGARSIVVPGYYAADGNAGESSATAGTKWRVHFAPDEEGSWTYTASFRTGTDIAASTDPVAGTATSFSGATGSFTIAATDKTGRDHRGKGMLRYANAHFLRFAQTGEFFIKGGADSPENFLAYGDFDQTTAKHAYAPHAADWQTGDPTWKGGKGKNMIGALNYLSGKGMNSVYFLTMNVTGDGNDVWPWTSSGERYRFDASKLDQWEVVFSHMDRKGLMLHVVTQETENDQLLDGGNLGLQRKLYYRELVARFGHHLAIVWNLGEENTNTDAQRKAFADFLRAVDPYDHPVVVHTYPGQYDTVYNPLLGHPSLEGPSLQMGSPSATHGETVKWVQRSAQNGRKWFVSLDEIGPANDGVVTDGEDFNHDGPRKNALWGNLMGGGAGCEWYFGYSHPHTDLTCEDWRSRDNMWNQTRHALTFFQTYLPFTEMVPSDGLTSSGWCFAKAGQVYAVYLPNGGSANLQVGSGTYSVQWYNPRAGGALQNGSVASVTGPGSVSIGAPPAGNDWVALVKSTGGSSGNSVASFTLVNADTDADLGPLAHGQTINLRTLPTRNLNVRANTSPAVVGSVRFTFSGTPATATESSAPYALAGDTGGNYNAWTPSLGSHTLSATPYSGSGATGTAGTALTISFTVIDQDPPSGPAVVSFTLMDADTDTPLLDPMNGGSTINLGTLPTRNLNVRANVNAAPIGSVRFAYDGNSTARTENSAPYALAGDTSGDYNAWTPTVGSHSLGATPYAGTGATGAAGTPLTITFTVIDQATAPSMSPSTMVASADPGTGGEGWTGGGGGSGGCGLLGIEAIVIALSAAAGRNRARSGRRARRDRSP